MALIALSKGKVAQVNDEDFTRLVEGAKWHYGGRGYAIRHVYISGKRTTERMHRLVLRAAPDEQVDHISHDTLDNRKQNLRKSNFKLNGANRLKQKTHAGLPPKSQFKGIWFNKERLKWCTRIKVNGKRIYLGRHSTEIEAAKAYDRAAVKFWGEHAYPNFPVTS